MLQQKTIIQECYTMIHFNTGKKQSILWHTDLIKETDSYTEVN